MEENQENPAKENEIIIEKTVKQLAKENAKELLAGSENEKTLVIRHDKATQVLPLRERLLFAAAGVIDSPLRYLQKRVDLIDQLATTILIDRDKMTIELHSNEIDYFGDKVAGKLTVHPDFTRFHINDPDFETTPKKLGDFLRMNRSVFVNKATCLNLVNTLKSFEAKVAAVVEANSANNGNRKQLYEQTVESNIPDKFEITLGLFKGQPAKKIEVEIILEVDGSQITCRLESPEAQQFMDEVKNQAIDDQIEKIKEVAPKVLIIEK